MTNGVIFHDGTVHTVAMNYWLLTMDVRHRALSQAEAYERDAELTFNRLEVLQEGRRQVSEELERLEMEIAKATIKRPTEEQVCAAWGLTEDERQEALGSLVQEVVVTQKDRVHLRLSPIASVHGQFIAINSEMGAGRSLNANSPMVFPLIRSSAVPLAPHAKRVIRRSEAA